MMSFADAAIDAAMGTLTETHGVPVKVSLTDASVAFSVRGIFDRNGTIREILDGMPIENQAVTIGFRRTDFINAGLRTPRQGDIVSVPNQGTFTIIRVSADDRIEITCVLRENNAQKN